jgi:hypothetical protein
MAYAQTNYSQLQGKTVNGVRPKYPISAIGCFITSFCNLEERFGRKIDPGTMDNELARTNLYMDVDDGVYDDVGWDTICKYDPNISIVKIGNGAPSDTNSIVKFNYKSTRTGNFTTHFCLVADAAKGLIVDSWDGQIKSWGAYGGPVAYATYAKKTAQPVTPVGDSMFQTDAEIVEFYQSFLNRTPTAAEIAGWRGQSKQRFAQVAKAEVQSIHRQLADVKAALANEQAKPPKEVIKEVVKIVEKPVEKIVIKEVPAPSDPDDITVNKNKVWAALSAFLSKFKKG